MAQARRLRPALPLVDRLQIGFPAWIGVSVGQMAGELDHSVGRLAPRAQPGIGEDLQHLRVLSQDRAGEGMYPAAAGI